MMSHELICDCLQLSPDRWPPDHYTLLGLEFGEADTRRIEQRVAERMEKLRRYQLTHTDQVTEGMNRLAQALVCLTDPVSKQAYDAKLRAGKRTQPRRSSLRSSRRMRRYRVDPGLSPAQAFPRWLLFAWILWVSIGVGGLLALVRYFPAIQESYSGVPLPARTRR
jgi:hypothetical protein